MPLEPPKPEITRILDILQSWEGEIAAGRLGRPPLLQMPVVVTSDGVTDTINMAQFAGLGVVAIFGFTVANALDSIGNLTNFQMITGNSNDQLYMNLLFPDATFLFLFKTDFYYTGAIDGTGSSVSYDTGQVDMNTVVAMYTTP